MWTAIEYSYKLGQKCIQILVRTRLVFAETVTYGKHMLAKIGPPSKTESLYPAHACALIMYALAIARRPTEALMRQS